MASVDNLNHEDAIAVLDSMLADITAIRAAVVAITAKLDADAGVTDTDYASTCDPAALTTTT
jgi:hypothetical protein